MQFLVLNAREAEDVDPEELATKVAQEFHRVGELYLAGVVRQIWHRGDQPGGCLLVEADTEADVRAALSTLPMVQAGLVRVATVIPLKPFAGFGPATA